jgi:hypothetical protein
VAVGVLVVAAVYWYYASAPSASAALMTQVYGATDVKQLEQIADNNPGTIAGRTARFEVARIMYQEGLRDLASADQRDSKDASPIVKLIKARTLYLELAEQVKDNPVLTQEALMWAARAEEALAGSPDPDTPGQPAGSIDRAIEYYQKLAAVTPESFQTKAAALRAKLLEDKRTQINDFYKKLAEYATKPKK